MPSLLTNLKLEVPEKLILFRLQFKNDRTRVDDTVRVLIREITLEALSLADPRAVFDRFDISSATDRTVVLNNGPVIESRAIAKLLKNSRQAVLLAGTLGRDISERIKKYSESDLTKAAILDAAASELADEVANAVQRIIAHEGRQAGLIPTFRYSPGYSDWPLSDQPVLLKTLTAGQIGLTCSELFILDPEKSVTALIGLEPGGTGCGNCADCDPSHRH